MINHFNSSIASVLGLQKATLLQKVYDYRTLNKSNGIGKHNGNVWVKINNGGLSEEVSYIKPRTITTYLHELVNEGYLDVFVGESFDRSASYCPTQTTIDILSGTATPVEKEKKVREKKTFTLEGDNGKTEESFDLFWKTYPKSWGSNKIQAKKSYAENTNHADELQKHAFLISLMVKYGVLEAKFIPNKEKWLSESSEFNENYYVSLYKKMGECMGKKTPFTPEQMRSDIDFIFKAYPGLKGVYSESRTYWLERIALEKEKNPFK